MDDDVGPIATQDMLLAIIGMLLLVVAVLMTHIGDPARAKSTAEGIKPPGAVMVEARWPDGLDTDVDLWVQAPGDVPVGYSNKGGLVFNLLRDDLGNQIDATGLNYENAFARGLIPGEYTVNLHLYRNRASVPEIPCTVVVSVQKANEPQMRQILATTTTLVREGQEKTALRFRLDDKGALVAGSVSSIQRPLRSMESKP